LIDTLADLLAHSVALATCTFVLSVTPGPNNVMLAGQS